MKMEVCLFLLSNITPATSLLLGYTLLAGLACAVLTQVQTDFMAEKH